MAATQTLPRQSVISQIPKHGVLTLYGFGIRVNMQSGHLVMEDGIGSERRKFRLARVAHGLRRLVVIGNDGMVSLAALRWLADQDAAFVMLNRDGKVLITTGPVRSSDAPLRRAQALAEQTGAGLRIARELISRKLAGQEQVARNKLLDLETANAIAQFQKRVEKAETLDEVRQLESMGAAEYWSAWKNIAIFFPKSDLRRVPDHWRVFDTRKSPLSGSQRLAANPANAMLNYLYAILESESRLALAAVGLDPGLGVLHMDAQGRDSFAFDLMEPIRPQIDSYVLDWITGQVLKREWFFEQRDGNCRLMADFASKLSETSPTWARAVAPYAEWVMHVLWRSIKGKVRKTLAPRTPLTQRRRTEGRGLRYEASKIAVAQPPRVCERCGADGVSNRFCVACMKEVSKETMVEVALIGGQVARTPQVKARVSRLLSDHAVANTWWSPADMPAWLTEQYFIEHIQPRLTNLKVREIANAIDVSHAYAALVRSGKRRPHPRHWQSLAQLVGAWSAP
jgi:CRISPR-associated endonuclease Cas1